MSIVVNEVYDASGAARASLGNISWAVWSGLPTAAAPAESGNGLSTDTNGLVTIPSVAASGYFMLRVSDTLMGIYQV